LRQQFAGEQGAAPVDDAVGKIVSPQLQQPRLLERRIDFGAALGEARPFGRDGGVLGLQAQVASGDYFAQLATQLDEVSRSLKLLMLVSEGVIPALGKCGFDSAPGCVRKGRLVLLE